MNAAPPHGQECIWETLLRQIRRVMAHDGKEDHFGKGDYLIVDDNYGWRRHTIEVHRLEILRPQSVRNLRRLLKGLPDWEIVISLDIPGTEISWPSMGVTIREREVVDDLQRSYLPQEFQDMRFEGSTPSTR